MAFQKMNEVVKNCFSVKTVDKSILKNQLNALKNDLHATEISVTVKLTYITASCWRVLR